MLIIRTQLLPQSELTYLAFRLAFCETMERLSLAYQVNLAVERPFGFLTEVPFLRNVVPHVQIDLLLDTWSRHIAADKTPATMLDESIIYAACETAARVIRTDPEGTRRFLRNGPLVCSRHPDQALADALQRLHLELPNEGHFLLLSQFQDLPPDDARTMKRKYKIDPDACECMFEALGRWHLRPDVAERARGIVTASESAKIHAILRLCSKRQRSRRAE